MELLILDDIHNFEVEYTDFHQSKTAGELFEIHQSAKNECTEEFQYIGSSDACVSFEPEETLPPITEVMVARPQNDQLTRTNRLEPSFKILTDEVSLSTRYKEKIYDFLYEFLNSQEIIILFVGNQGTKTSEKS